MGRTLNRLGCFVLSALAWAWLMLVGWCAVVLTLLYLRGDLR